jgi:hypothetical protein
MTKCVRQRTIRRMTVQLEQISRGEILDIFMNFLTRGWPRHAANRAAGFSTFARNESEGRWGEGIKARMLKIFSQNAFWVQ